MQTTRKSLPASSSQEKIRSSSQVNALLPETSLTERTSRLSMEPHAAHDDQKKQIIRERGEEEGNEGQEDQKTMKQVLLLSRNSAKEDKERNRKKEKEIGK